MRDAACPLSTRGGGRGRRGWPRAEASCRALTAPRRRGQVRALFDGDAGVRARAARVLGAVSLPAPLVLIGHAATLTPY